MQQAKIIIAHFLKKKVEDIDQDTVMDYTVVPSSLLLHRMYAELADKDYMIDDPASITTYADFLEILSSSSSSAQINDNEAKSKYVNEIINNSDSLIKPDNILSVGIDLEEISSFKSVNNYMEDPFYKSNFTLEEIEYCKTKVSPLESFAGLFSIKEAIVKADNSFKKIKFNKINISHTNDHEPTYKGFALSISHSKNYVVAIAYKKYNEKSQLLLTKEIREVVIKQIKKIVFIPMIIIMLFLFFIIVYGFLL